MEDNRGNLKLPEESLRRIEDHLKKMEAQLEHRVKVLENKATGISITIGVLLVFIVYMLFRAWDKL